MTQKTKGKFLWALVLLGFFIVGVIMANMQNNSKVDAKPSNSKDKGKVESMANNDLKEITIESLKVTENSIGEQLVNITLKNNTDKILKSIEVGIIGYNQDDQCIKFNFGNDDIYMGKTKNIDIKPNDMKEVGWQVYPDGKLEKIKVCIDTYQFEGEKMQGNKYFKIWKTDNIK
ncbi:DUF5780 domain-containing protein [Clostridium fallax]|uniref:DUF5780 domain-containing protein n=1 Tax=Clostridium fallax TaxID=1533 RepID=A0A1M4XSB1_9CLOT|nr:DUF5780 domain-containing protein [Clostridium fallax]SHE96280.1 hypothetical protein SAMN05443638_12030 [Clostridium fallax]SQB08064.1 Uncharacterised protein [Clostridium fallax]